MPYRAFFGSSGLRIEVEDDSGGRSSSYSEDFAEAIRAMAGFIVGRVGQFGEENRPSQLSVTFGLKALASGGFAIGNSDDAGNFKILMTWNSSDQIPNLESVLPDNGP